MSGSVMSQTSPNSGDSTAAARRTAMLLAACQALYLSCAAIGLTLTGIVGAMLAPDRALATLPFALVTVATALTTIPASLLMARWGRRPVFMIGATLGSVGGLISTVAIVTANFPLFCLGNMGMGVFQACAQYYRFAAADAADPAFKPRAIGLVIGGGVVAAVIGPTLAAWSRDLLAPHGFAGSFLAVAGLALLSVVILSRLDLPRASALVEGPAPRPLGVLLRNPAFAVAVLCGSTAYGVMIFVMTATPLAVVGCGFGVTEAASVIQWHLIGMFAPGFFSGRLIARFGVTPVLLTGAGLFFAGFGVAHLGTALLNFEVALILVGIAWNFMFVGATTLLSQSHAPAERAKAQAANEFLTFGIVAIGSLSAGAVLQHFGWEMVTTVSLPAIGLAAAATIWLRVKTKHDLAQSV